MRSDPASVARYTEGPKRFVPGFSDIHKMATVLFDEQDGEIAARAIRGHMVAGPRLRSAGGF